MPAALQLATMVATQCPRIQWAKTTWLRAANASKATSMIADFTA
jgi:hypothetical protein